MSTCTILMSTKRILRLVGPYLATSEPFPKQEGQLRLPAGAGGMGGLVGALSGAAAGGGAQGGAGAWASDDDEEMMPLRSGPGRDVVARWL